MYIMFLIHSNSTLCTRVIPSSQLDLYLSLVPTFCGMQHLKTCVQQMLLLLLFFYCCSLIKTYAKWTCTVRHCGMMQEEELQWAVLI